jgi:predicted  nucleic acid-binding Zn-ribbon protein
MPPNDKESIMAEATLETRVNVLTSEVDDVKRKIRRMEEELALDDALARAARRDSLNALDLIPKIDDGVLALRVELKTEIGSVRNDLADFRAEVTDFRAEVIDFRAEVTGFRAEVNHRFGAVDEQFGAVNEQFGAVNKQFGAVNKRLDEHGELLKKIADRLDI